MRLLLSSIKIGIEVYTEVFESSIGGPQDDGLSSKIFTLYLAAVLCHMRALTNRTTPPSSELGMPQESEYSDDVGFMDTDQEGLDNLLLVVADIFGEGNLQINEAKIEFIHFRVAGSERREDGTLVRGDEEWCLSKFLGSLMS